LSSSNTEIQEEIKVEEVKPTEITTEKEVISEEKNTEIETSINENLE
jgi:hypothetical protein